MIPIILFAILVIILFALIIYSLMDNENRLYGNVIGAIIAAIMSAMLGQMLLAGVVGDTQMILNGTNATDDMNSSITTTYTYLPYTTTIVDTTTAYLLWFVSSAMFILGIMMIVDALSQKFEARGDDE
jgi:glycerol uptake facilitator-like aquaporin